MHCQECRHQTYITCDTEMHPSISCGERLAEREGAQRVHELATTGYLMKRAETCPGARLLLNKNGGV